MCPRQSPTTHTEQLGDEASVYDWARGEVHALNPTAARVWRNCDGATSREAIAALLRVELGIPEAEAIVDLTLAHLARVHLLELPIESRSDRSKTTRRWLISRGVTAALLPAIYSIVAPSPVEAQSVGSAVPTLTSVTPNQGSLGTTVPVTLTGTNFVIGATTVTVNSGGVSAANVIVSSATSLTCDIAIAANATPGAHTVTVTTASGTSGAQTFTASTAPPAPTLTSVTPNQGSLSTTVSVTLAGTNFVVGATTVNVSAGGVTVSNVVVGSVTSLTADFAIAAAATSGAHSVTVTTAGGTSGAQTFTVSAAPPPPAPTLTSISPIQGFVSNTVAVTLTGTNFIIGGTTVAVSGSGVTVNNVIVSSATSLTADFVIGAAPLGARTVTVTTAGGTSGPQTFTIVLPASGSVTFAFTGSPQTFTVPAGVVSLTILATGASGGGGTGGAGGLGGRTTATVSVAPGASITVGVGGQGLGITGGFNGGGNGISFGGGGGGASSVRNGSTPLVIVGGGGGGGAAVGGGPAGGGTGGGGGGLSGISGGAAPAAGGGGGGGGTQTAGGVGGVRANVNGTNGTAGVADQGGNGGAAQGGVIGGGGGGGGYFGGGGGGGGNTGVAGGGGGGGGSSFAAPGATAVLHEQGVKAGNGFVTISW